MFHLFIGMYHREVPEISPTAINDSCRESSATEGFVYVMDMADYGWSNFSLSTSKKFFEVLQVRKKYNKI